MTMILIRIMRDKDDDDDDGVLTIHSSNSSNNNHKMWVEAVILRRHHQPQKKDDEDSGRRRHADDNGMIMRIRMAIHKGVGILVVGEVVVMIEIHNEGILLRIETERFLHGHNVMTAVGYRHPCHHCHHCNPVPRILHVAIRMKTVWKPNSVVS